MFDTPILFLIFNRPDTTKTVFEQIREVKPQYLYIAADGPRENRPDEAAICQQTRDIVLSSIDWICEVKTLFKEQNLGCGKAVRESISWFFQNVEMGIILEDDCLPDLSFFRFCNELLEKYKNEKKILSICGTNIHLTFSDNHSYVYSLYSGIWGWASWRRSWELYDSEMVSWGNINNQKIVRKNLQSENEYFGIKNIFDCMISENRIDTWDIQWFYSGLLNNKLTIFPTKNLIKNIGFGSNGTHTHDQESPLNKLTLNKIDFPLVHNEIIKPNRDFDRACSIKYGWYLKIDYLKRIKKLIGRLINGSKTVKNFIVRLIKKNKLIYKFVQKNYARIFPK